MAGRVLPKAIRAFGGAGFVAAAVLTQMCPAPAHAANVPDPVNAACAATGACWSTMTTTNPGGPNFSNSLGGVSCPSPTFCVAVGYSAAPTGGYTNLAELWNGSSWSTMTTQNPGTNANALYNTLIGVSCKPSSFCVAVGSYVGASNGQTLAETYGNSLGLSI